jgi:probable phosphoglycerate mutase
VNPELSTRVIAVRHGETAWNADLRIQGHTDIPLNERGRWQAERLALALAHEEVHAVYSSDLQRARDTALAFARSVGLPVVHEAGLRERQFGRFEGLTFAEIESRWPDEAQRWRQRDPDFAPGDGGEALGAFHARSVASCAALAERHRGQTILVVSHGGVLDCLYRAATRATAGTPRSWQIGNATVNRLLHSDAGFNLVGWNDASHFD